MIFTLHFRFTNNNVFVNVIDQNKKTRTILTSKKLGFAGSRKTGLIALTSLINELTYFLEKLKIYKINLSVCGYSSSLKSVIQLLLKKNFLLTSFTNVTPVPHNGCKVSTKARK